MKKIKLFIRTLTGYNAQHELEDEVNQFLRKLHEAGVKNITVTMATHTIDSESRNLYGQVVIMVTWDGHSFD